VDDAHLEQGYLKVLGKGNKERLVPIGHRCQEALLRWRDRFRRLFEMVESPFLFLNSNGGPLTVQARSFGEMLERAVRAYQSRAIETAQVIEELIQLAKDMKAAEARGEELGLTDQELAFYDALEVNDSAVKVLGDDTLRTIARELVDTVRRNVTIDWSVKESIRAKLRTVVKRVLRRHGYPPDKQEQATITVLQQAELLSWELAA